MVGGGICGRKALDLRGLRTLGATHSAGFFGFRRYLGILGTLGAMNDRTDRNEEAFRRLLAEGNAGGQAKTDALTALSQRTVRVAQWTPNGDGYRTLVNSDGDAALPVFTSTDELMTAARRFGWLDPMGNVPHKEVGAREALRYAVAHQVSYVVVDIAADHTLEASLSDIEPLLGPPARRQSSRRQSRVGPSAAAVAPTATPGQSGVTLPAASAPSQPIPPPGATDGAPGVAVEPLPTPPEDALLDALAEVLRSYPEVEWASLASVAQGPAGSVPTIGLRVDTGYRQRVDEILGKLREAGSTAGASLDCLLLDDAIVMRAARQKGLVFYPWRRR